MILDSLLYQKKQLAPSKENGNERVSRSIAKSVSWRTIGTLDTIVISWMVTGTLQLALSIGMIELITKMTLYVLHERVWNRIRWGK